MWRFEQFRMPLQDGTCAQLCVLSLPAGVGFANFCSFVGAFLARIRELRVVRREGGRGSCMVLLQFKDVNTADSFYANYNDRPVGLRRAVAPLSQMAQLLVAVQIPEI